MGRLFARFTHSHTGLVWLVSALSAASVLQLCTTIDNCFPDLSQGNCLSVCLSVCLSAKRAPSSRVARRFRRLISHGHARAI